MERERSSELTEREDRRSTDLNYTIAEEVC
jgi:hypothetical protein